MSNVVKFKKRAAMATQCTACGAAGMASCDCGAPYVPAVERAEEGLKDPEIAKLTTREAAKKIGVSKNAVHRARKTVVPSGTTEKLIGKGGKKFNPTKPVKAKEPQPTKPPPRIAMMLSDEPCTDCNTQQEQWQRSLSNMASEAISLSAYWTHLFGKDWQKFEVTSDVLTLAKQAAAAWNDIVESMINGEKGE
jgi:hypothetical protein